MVHWVKVKTEGPEHLVFKAAVTLENIAPQEEAEALLLDVTEVTEEICSNDDNLLVLENVSNAGPNPNTSMIGVMMEHALGARMMQQTSGQS